MGISKQKLWFFHFLAILHICEISNASDWQSYAICASKEVSKTVRHWLDEVELELELINNVLVKKCPLQNGNNSESVQVLIKIGAAQKNESKNLVSIKVYAHDEFIWEDFINEVDFVAPKASVYARSLQKNIAQREQEKIAKIVLNQNWPIETENKPLPSVPSQKDAKLFISSSIGGESWCYQFIAKNESFYTPAIQSQIYPKFYGNIVWWPLEWLSLYANGSLGISAFRFEIKDASAFETQGIWARHYQVDSGAKGRYVFSNGFGLGFNIGYFFQRGAVDVQMYNGKYYTQLPSFDVHALELGGEVYFKSEKKKLDMALLVGALPLVNYQENPDFPGQNVTAFGLNAQITLRHFFKKHWFIVLNARATGLYGIFQGLGTRITAQQNTLDGGVLFSYMLSGSLGIGWSF